jgi:hypothetical protein
MTCVIPTEVRHWKICWPGSANITVQGSRNPLMDHLHREIAPFLRVRIITIMEGMKEKRKKVKPNIAGEL